MRGSRKSQILALLALAVLPPPAHGSDLIELSLARDAGVFALCGCAAWMWMQAHRRP